LAIATSSVEAVQVSVIEVGVTTLAVRLAGVVGGAVSGRADG
jgi:hypothetical protein